jgi:hypothetical protein
MTMLTFAEDHGRVVDLLEAVQRELAATALSLALPGSAEARRDFRNALAQFEDSSCRGLCAAEKA